MHGKVSFGLQSVEGMSKGQMIFIWRENKARRETKNGGDVDANES